MKINNLKENDIVIKIDDAIITVQYPTFLDTNFILNCMNEKTVEATEKGRARIISRIIRVENVKFEDGSKVSLSQFRENIPDDVYDVVSSQFFTACLKVWQLGKSAISELSSEDCSEDNS